MSGGPPPLPSRPPPVSVYDFDRSHAPPPPVSPVPLRSSSSFGHSSHSQELAPALPRGPPPRSSLYVEESASGSGSANGFGSSAPGTTVNNVRPLPAYTQDVEQPPPYSDGPAAADNARAAGSPTYPLGQDASQNVRLSAPLDSTTAPLYPSSAGTVNPNPTMNLIPVITQTPAPGGLFATDSRPSVPLDRSSNLKNNTAIPTSGAAPNHSNKQLPELRLDSSGAILSLPPNAGCFKQALLDASVRHRPADHTTGRASDLEVLLRTHPLFTTSEAMLKDIHDEYWSQNGHKPRALNVFREWARIQALEGSTAERALFVSWYESLKASTNAAARAAAQDIGDRLRMTHAEATVVGELDSGTMQELLAHPRTPPHIHESVLPSLWSKSSKKIDTALTGADIFAEGHAVHESAIARALTAIDASLFRQIEFPHVMRENWSVSAQPELVQMRNQSHKITQWLATELIVLPSLHRKHAAKRGAREKFRANLLKQVISLGYILYQMKNLHGVDAVYQALMQPAVARLRAWRDIAQFERTQVQWVQIRSLCGEDSDSVYTTEIGNAVRFGHPCIPSIRRSLLDIEAACIGTSVRARERVAALSDAAAPINDHASTGGLDWNRLAALCSILSSLTTLQRRAYSRLLFTDEELQQVLQDGDIQLAAESPEALLVRAVADDIVEEEKIGSVDTPIDQQPWFYGEAPRAEVEAILQRETCSSYLVRKSTTKADQYVLSYWNVAERICDHVLIDESVYADAVHTRRNDNGRRYCVHGSELHFRTLEQLVKNTAVLYGLHPAVNAYGAQIKRQLGLSTAGMSTTARTQDSHVHALSSAVMRFFADNRYASSMSSASPTEPALARAAGPAIDRDALRQAENAVTSRDVGTLLDMLDSGELPVTALLTQDRRNLVHIAADLNSPGMIDHIYSFSARRVPDLDAKDLYGWTPLHAACKEGFVAVVEALLNYGVRVNPLNHTGTSPLHYLVRKPVMDTSYEIVLRRMVEMGAPVNCQDTNGETPLHQACRGKNQAAVKFLLTRGADAMIEDINGVSCEQMVRELNFGSLLTRERHVFPPQIVAADSAFKVETHTDNRPSASGLINVRPSTFRDVFVGRTYSAWFAPEQNGSVSLLAFLTDQSSSTIFVRSSLADRLWQLPYAPKDVSSVVTTMGLAGGALEQISNPTFDSLAVESEEAFQWGAQDHDIQFGILYMPQRCFRWQDVEDPGNLMCSPAFSQFLRLMGEQVGFRDIRNKTANPRANAGKTDDNSSIITKLDGLHLLFHCSHYMKPSLRRKFLEPQRVVIVFLEGHGFDTTMFDSHDNTAVVILVQPLRTKGNEVQQYRIKVAVRRGVSSFGPDLDGVYTHGDALKRLIQTKAVNGMWVAAHTHRFGAAEREHREQLLRQLHQQYRMLPKITTGILPSEDAAAKKAQYLLGRELGRGATGVTYLCKHKVSNARNCMKVVDKSVLSKGLSEQVQKETLFLSQLRHPNIVGLQEFFESEDQLYLVLQLCEGGDLQGDIEENGPYTEADAKRFLRQLLDALQYMHKKGVLHRDLKPENILFDKAGRRSEKNVILADFGLGRNVQQTLAQTFCGTMDYIAPEVMKGLEYDDKVDVWGAGCIACALLTGKPPFAHHSSPMAVMTAVANGDFDISGLSEAAAGFVRRVLVVDPKKRPTAAEALRHEWLKN